MWGVDLGLLAHPQLPPSTWEMRNTLRNDDQGQGQGRLPGLGTWWGGDVVCLLSGVGLKRWPTEPPQAGRHTSHQKVPLTLRDLPGAGGQRGGDVLSPPIHTPAVPWKRATARSSGGAQGPRPEGPEIHTTIRRRDT